MNATQNDITASDINIQHIEERNIFEIINKIKYIKILII